MNGIIHQVLRDDFKRDQFRANQAEIIDAVLAKKDVLVVLPTGHGKSLTFQLPAVVEAKAGGFYIVISPLLALMKDQVQALQNLGVSADTINSTTSRPQKLAILDSFERGEKCLLYCSAEQCFSEMFGQFVRRCSQKGLINRVVIDEAHCAVEWGESFRKDYARLGSEFRPMLAGSVPFMALTGTASPTMQKQLTDVLALKSCSKFIGEVRRPYLHFEVRYIEDPADRLANCLRFLKMYRGRIAQLSENTTKYPGCGVVYCRRRDETEKVADEINSVLGPCARPYNAGMPIEEREDILDKFVRGDRECSIVVATVAFGLGIDKPDVRFVIHLNLPSNIEAYAQQTGRAGRDRKAARCILYFSRDEALKCRDLAQPSERQSAIALLRFSTEMRCRHDALGNYFGDTSREFCDFACDFCKNSKRLEKKFNQWEADLL